MLGLCCKEEDTYIIPSLQPITNIIIVSGFNTRWLGEFLETLKYKPDTCLFCYKKLNSKQYFINNLVIVLSCDHVFHLICFIKYSKFNYIDQLCKNNSRDKNDKTTRSTCIICRKKIKNILTIFNSYYKLLKNIKNLQTDFHNQYIM